MPLKCLQDTQELFSFDYTAQEWSELQSENRKLKHLRMSCCAANVVLRKSTLGTQHFAHMRRGPCTTAPESAEHLLAKLHIVQAMKSVQHEGWAVYAEKSGMCPLGNHWRADTMATKGVMNIAFEVQWSRQSDEETLARHKRYADSGVRCIWFMKQKELPVSEKVPAFHLEFDNENKEFYVWIPGGDYKKESIKYYRQDRPWFSITNSQEEEKESGPYSLVWSQRIPLKTFVAGVLKGNLWFAPSVGTCLPIEIHGGYQTCWKCGHQTGCLTEITIASPRRIPHVLAHSFSLQSFDGVPKKDFDAFISPDLLRMSGIGEIKKRSSKTAGYAYLSNGCIRCDALQGRFYEHELDCAKVFEFEGVLNEEIITNLGCGHKFLYWWFDVRESEQETCAALE